MSAELECRQLVENYAKAVQTQNWRDFDIVFSKQKECRLISGRNEYVGRDAIFQEFLVERIGKKFSRITLVVDDVEFNHVMHNVMIIVFRYHTECILRENGEPFGIQGVETQFAALEDGAWHLVHVHYS